jgi:hypothetical protein
LESYGYIENLADHADSLLEVSRSRDHHTREQMAGSTKADDEVRMCLTNRDSI